MNEQTNPHLEEIHPLSLRYHREAFDRSINSAFVDGWRRFCKVQRYLLSIGQIHPDGHPDAGKINRSVPLVSELPADFWEEGGSNA